MPRLRQVPKAEAPTNVLAMYDMVFGERDPVADPGTHGGTTGDFWTVFANSPDIFDNVVGMFKVYRSRRRKLDPVLRELAQTRVGWLTQSKFVYSQHCKSLRDLGVSEERINAVAIGPASHQFDPHERLVLAYADCLVSDHGRTPDGLFDELHGFMTDEQILELTFISCVYLLNGVMSRALKLEFDDREEAVVEVPGNQGFFDEKHDWANNSTSPTVKKQQAAANTRAASGASTQGAS